ncbi:accessory gene regulator AgrB [Lactiplantibacillus plantarum]|nr:accessory gene regulator B family protein [Lactiplantibacillus plantarum]BEI51524.1 accessory gene regulator AgrB [Lactiplantibacillus plantarum]
MEKPEQKLLLYKLSDRLFAAIQKNLQLERRQALLVKLGIDTVLNVIPKLIITIILALLLHELVPVLVFMGSFLVLRGFAYGRHLKSDLLCTILTIFVFVGVPYVIGTGISEVYRLLLSLIFVIIISIFAPARYGKESYYIEVIEKKIKATGNWIVINFEFVTNS